MIDIQKALNTPLELTEIVQYKLNEDQYTPEDIKPVQIYIHHTAGNPNPFRVVDFWNSNPDRVGTAFVIGGEPSKDKNGKELWQDGAIVQAFSSKKWGYHLGLKQDTFTKYGVKYSPLDKSSIGIEINNWGGLDFKDGKYFTYVGSVVDADEVVEYATPFRGHKFYHKYTDKQIENTIRLVKYLCEKYRISKAYNEDMWDVTPRALQGTSGVWTHVSVRPDKSDVHPQKELVEALKTLGKS
jgi:N-acetyl-anhydromuramyl-L-alanine amidase AmpD